jgi:hypothetical protein
MRLTAEGRASMHRKSNLAQLAKRKRKVPVVGSATNLLVRTGVKATYQLHDRMLSNPGAKKRFSEHRPALDGEQQEIVDSLRAEGLVVLPFSKLFDAGLWNELSESSADFARKIEDDLREEEESPSEAILKARAKGSKKQFLRRSYAPGPVELPLENPWLKLGISTRLLDIVNTYVGLWSKLSYVDQWYTVPVMDAESERISSQRWHRDYNDQYLVKVFLYMNDVDEGSGPFEYVPRSHIGGDRYSDFFPWAPFGEDLYPPSDELQRRIPPEASRLLTAPAGTMIFCDTTGFHRGGFATEGPRIMGVYNYVSQASLASLAERNFTVDPGSLPSGTPEQVRFALE